MLSAPFLDVSPEVRDALSAGQPVVALESTIISHGMPYPQNVATALRVEAEVRAAGAVPATVAIVQGRLKAGLGADEIEALGRAGPQVAKVSRRDHGGGHHDHCGAGGYPGVCHGRHRRRAPGRGREL